MGVALFGGGYFYAPFSQTVVGSQLMGTDALANTWGGWMQILPVATVPGRWVDLFIFAALPAPLGNANYQVQLGLGALGLETVWQPTSPTPFQVTIDSTNGQFWRQYTFPVTIQAGVRISGRCQANAAGPLVLRTQFTYWG